MNHSGKRIALGLIAASALAIGYCLVSAGTPAGVTPPEYRFPVAAVRVIDGDTIVGHVDLPWNVTLRGQHIRLLGVNAWEITGPQRPDGLKAQEFTVQVIESGDVWIAPTGKRQRDDFGRALGWVYVRTKNGQWRDLAAELIDRGHGKPLAE